MNCPTVESIRREFIEGSAISESVFDTAVRVVVDEEYDPHTNEVSALPIEENLGWMRSHFGHHPRYNLLAAQFVNEDGTTWQLKVFGNLHPNRENQKSGSYLAPKGIGDVPYLPPLPREVIEEVANKHGLTPPGEGQPFWDWFLENKSIPLVITEGGKKSLASISQGAVALSLFGCTCGVQDLAIKPELLPFVQGRRVTVAFDEDIKETTKDKVWKATKRLGAALASHAKADVYVATWKNSDGKGADDLIANDPALFHQALAEALPFQRWRKKGEEDLSPFIVETRDERFLGPVNFKALSRLVGLLVRKGGGKTESIAQGVSSAISEGKPIIVPLHREQLVLEISRRLGIPYRTEYRDNEARTDLGYALCVNSLHSKASPGFHPEDWEDCWVILDEAEQVSWHMLDSATCRGFRPAILGAFEKLLNVAEKIILADANLNRRSLDYVCSLLDEPTTPAVVANTWKSTEPKSVTVYQRPEDLLGFVHDAIDQGQRLLIHCGAAEVKSKWGTQNLEKLLSRPGLRVLRIDAKSVADPEHPAYGCMGNLNEVLPNYDLVIASPTIETGVSIDITGHFDAVVSFGSGVQTVEAYCQSLERLREAVPRHIYCPERSSQRIGNGSESVRSLMANQTRKFAATVKLLAEADTLSALEGRKSAHLLTWCRYAAHHNGNFKRYRAEVLRLLQGDGYVVSYAEAHPEADAHKQIARDMAQFAYQEECESIAAAPVLPPAEYDRLSRQRAKTESERHAEKKTALTYKYATEDVSPDLVAQDDTRGWYPGLLMHYYLSMGKAFLKGRDKKKIQDLAPNGKAFAPDVNAATYSVRVEALRLIGIEQFLREGATFTRESLADWYENLLQYRWDIREALGLTIHAEKDTPIAVAQRLLGLLGLKLTGLGQRRKDGKRVREYQMQDLSPDGRDAIFLRWLDRDSKREDYPPIPIAA